jgi:uncharacterized protein
MDSTRVKHRSDVALQPESAKPLTQASSLNERRKQIRLVRNSIVGEFNPEKIILFGSYANGKPRPHSDIDLLVVMPFDGSPFRQAALILGHVVRTVGVLPMDLIVRTSQQVRERLQIGDSFMREISENGKVIYEADHS